MAVIVGASAVAVAPVPGKAAVGTAVVTSVGIIVGGTVAEGIDVGTGVLITGPKTVEQAAKPDIKMANNTSLPPVINLNILYSFPPYR
jgi:hypothetical protein